MRRLTDSIRRDGAIRLVKIGLVAAVALWGLVGALSNLSSWDNTLGTVGAVTSMATIEGGAESWKATTNPAVIWLGGLFIALSKLAAGLLCGAGAWRMWRARAAGPAEFAAARTIALAGCGVAIFMLFGGFIVIAEGWFELWRSQSAITQSLPTAFRYAGLIALIGIFVVATDD